MNDWQPPKLGQALGEIWFILIMILLFVVDLASDVVIGIGMILGADREWWDGTHLTNWWGDLHP